MILIAAACVVYALTRGAISIYERREQRRMHEPRALKLIEAAKVESDEALELRLKLMRPSSVGPQSLAGAIMGGLARMDGTCTRCGGYWNEAHGDAPSPVCERRYVRPAPTAMPGPPERRRG